MARAARPDSLTTENRSIIKIFLKYLAILEKTLYNPHIDRVKPSKHMGMHPMNIIMEVRVR